jgi:hypothetical protein
MIAHCQLGFSKTLKEGQLIQVYHNNIQLDRNGGEYLSAMAKRKSESWYMRSINCSQGDIIIIESKVGLRELGVDEDRSFTAIFAIDSGEKETEFKHYKVGFGHGFPLIKGQIKQLSFLTEKEKRLSVVKSKLETGDDHENQKDS